MDQAKTAIAQIVARPEQQKISIQSVGFDVIENTIFKLFRKSTAYVKSYTSSSNNSNLLSEALRNYSDYLYYDAD